VGGPGQSRFTAERAVAELMGGNIVDSPVAFFGGWWVGTLLGPEGAARLRVWFLLPGSSPGPHRLPAVRVARGWGLVVPL
jgi:hypothetical protein